MTSLGLYGVWQSLPMRFVLHLAGLIGLGWIGALLVPDPFTLWLKTYLMTILTSLTVGVLIGDARGWLVWVGGTLAWSLAMNALCVSYLMTLVSQ